MPQVCLVGLPRQLQRRVIGEARRKAIAATLLLVDRGPNGSLWFVPNPEYAKQILDVFTLSVDEGEESVVYVLPYTPLPSTLAEQIDAFEELGGRVETILPGDSFPPRVQGNLDQEFLELLFRGISSLFPQAALPSEYFQEIARRNSRFLITQGALDSCDRVAAHRFSFMIKCADAFDQLLLTNPSGRAEEFFEKLGLEHAQSGGITTTLEIEIEGAVQRTESNLHLKRGDNTTAISAARVYYQRLTIRGATFIALMYAGPHPEKAIGRKHTL